MYRETIPRNPTLDNSRERFLNNLALIKFEYLNRTVNGWHVVALNFSLPSFAKLADYN